MSTPSDRSGAAKAEANRAPASRSERPVGERQHGRPSDRARVGGAGSLVGGVLSGRYLIERLIGEGGMGAVYQAEHTHMRKRMAVKVLHAEMSRLPEVVARFEREAMAAAHIEHPNVAAATDFGKLEDGSFFLVLEYVEGKSLREAMAGGRVGIARVLHVGRQIASALGRAHALGIVHRDLKPENVMLVTREGDPDFVKVLDFGIAKVPMGEIAGDSKGQVLTQLGMVYGTPEYMAPEQALGQPVDARADLYALGVIMFEMLTGARPYDHASKVTLLGMHVTAPIPRMRERAPDADIPEEMDAIVSRLLAKEASARFADARELVEALDQVATEAAPAARAQGPRASGPRLNPETPGQATSGFGPTKLAQPATTAPPGFMTLVGASLGQVVRKAPPWATRRVVAGGAAGLILAALLVGVLGGGASSTPAASDRATGAAKTAAPRVDPKTSEIVAAAQANIEKGDFATAVEQLTAIERTSPERADVHMGLEKAYTGARNGREAMREAALWLAADPAAAADHKLEEDIRNAALVKETQDSAFELLESKMGSLGVDILYDIAYGTSGRLYPQAAARAKHSLGGSEVRGRASPALDVLIDLREAKGCDAKHSLLERARDQGDVRVLPLLQQYQVSRGCGFLGVSDCYPCMRKDELLAEAISALQERAAKAP
jgi:eukaryotic-like serine/threonine-protein kinase